MLKLKPLTYPKRIMKQYATLHSKFNSLVKKAGVMRTHPLLPSNVKKFLKKDFQKNLNDFANKRQVKHISTVLEPSIPIHTLVKLFDAGDIANDKIRTHDLALEVNIITKHLHKQTLESSSQEQLMFTQPKDPNNKNKPAYKNIVQIVTEQITPSLLVSKNNEMMKTNAMHMLDQNLLKNHLYSTSALLLIVRNLELDSFKCLKEKAYKEN